MSFLILILILIVIGLIGVALISIGFWISWAINHFDENDSNW